MATHLRKINIEGKVSGNLAEVNSDNELLVNDSSLLYSTDPQLRHAMGEAVLLSRIHPVNKFGSSSNIDTTPTDVWDHATQNIWLPPTQARVHEIVSTSDEDSDTGGTVAQGDGARTIRIWGLKTWDLKETSEDIIMDGTATGANSVDTAESYVIIHRMKVLTTGSTGMFSNVGTISAVAKVDGTVTAQILAIKGRTQMAIFGVPSTQRFFMYGFHASLAKDSPGLTPKAGVILLSTVDVVNNPFTYAFEHTATIQGDGSTSITVPFSPPKDDLDGPCIIKMAMVAADNNTLADASFDGILVDN